MLLCKIRDQQQADLVAEAGEMAASALRLLRLGRATQEATVAAKPLTAAEAAEALAVLALQQTAQAVATEERDLLRQLADLLSPTPVEEEAEMAALQPAEAEPGVAIATAPTAPQTEEEEEEVPEFPTAVVLAAPAAPASSSFAT